MYVKQFWILYWWAAFLLSLGSIMMRCWEDGGLKNLTWWIGLHVAGWVLLAAVVWLLASGPLHGVLEKMRAKIEMK